MNPILAEEYRAQLEESIFSEPATFFHGRGVEATVNVQYDEQFMQLDPESGMPILSTQPAFKIFLGSIPPELFTAKGVIGQGTPVRIRDRSFRVSEFRPDGLGAALIRLHE